MRNMRKKLPTTIMAAVLSTSVFADAPRKSPWNYTSASNYAYQWALSRNANYINFSNDCTNFASQALRAGGWKDTVSLQSTQASSWYYKSATSYAQTWSTANGLRYRFTNGYELGTTKLPRSLLGTVPEYLHTDIRLGDIIFADWNDDGIYDHTMVVTQVNLTSTLVSYHSNDNRDKSMLTISLENPNARFEVYHIT